MSGIIVLKRFDRQPGESDAEVILRALVGFASGAKSTADISVRDEHGALIEGYKRGKADGMQEAAQLVQAVALELRIREAEAVVSEQLKAAEPN